MDARDHAQRVWDAYEEATGHEVTPGVTTTDEIVRHALPVLVDKAVSARLHTHTPMTPLAVGNPHHMDNPQWLRWQLQHDATFRQAFDIGVAHGKQEERDDTVTFLASVGLVHTPRIPEVVSSAIARIWALRFADVLVKGRHEGAAREAGNRA